jgi:hypothetical protein
MIDGYRKQFGLRADAIADNLIRQNIKNVFYCVLARLGWCILGRPNLLKAFAKGLTDARNSLDPQDKARSAPARRRARE